MKTPTLKHLFWSAALAVLLPARLQAVPPTNDSFANATVITGASGTINGTNVEATLEIDEPDLGYRSVWYSWTAPASGDVTVDTNGTNFDTVLGIYTGPAVNALTEIVTDDESGIGSASLATFVAASGTTYQIVVTSYSASHLGAVTKLNWSLAVPPANDNFAQAVAITGASGTSSGGNSSSTRELGEPGSGSFSIWYSWTALSTGKAVFDTFGTGRDTYLGIGIGTEVDTLTTFVENNDSKASIFGESRLKIEVKSGVVYKIRLSSNGSNVGAMTLHWKMVSQPANDLFAQPTTITGISGTITGSTYEATVEPFEPNLERIEEGDEPAQSIWYSWVAPFTGVVRFDTMGSEFYPTLLVANTADLSTLNVVVDRSDGGNDNKVVFSVTSGSTYRIRIGSSEEGGTSLNWAQVTDYVPSVISLAGASYSGTEGGPAVSISLTRNAGTTNTAVSCTLYTQSGSADAADYVDTFTTVNFATGATTATVNIPLRQDRRFEGEETFNVRLTAPTEEECAFGLSIAEVNIADDEPFIPLKANYTGLIQVFPHDNALSGTLRINATGNGSFTGSLMLGSTVAAPFSGAFNAAGKSTVTVVRRTGGNVLLNLFYADNGNRIRALVSMNGKTANIQAWRIIFGGAVEIASKPFTFTARIKGLYTAVGDVPKADGFLSITVSTTGLVKIVGTLADDTTVTSSGQMAGYDMYPMYASLYAGKGSLCCDMLISEERKDFSDLVWFKTAAPTDKSFKGGFTQQTTVETRPYIFSKRQPIIDGVLETQGAAECLIKGPGLPANGLSQIFRLLEDNSIALPLSPQVKLTLKFVPATGFFSGTYQLTTEKPTAFKGAVFQSFDGFYGESNSSASGFFLAPGAGGLLSSGTVQITPYQ